MKFPETTGSIQHVDRHHYDDLVNLYVNRVKEVDGVLGIVLFGSVSTLGLSDIDLVVTLPDEGPWPAWEDISLKRIAEGHPAESVVAHDIFVWPQSVASRAESFFYLDRQSVLHGSALGGKLDPVLTSQFKELLSMDYLIHRFDSLSALLTAPQVSLRSVLLFISTLRHTCHLAAELNLMTRSDSDKMVSDIADLRSAAVETTFTADLLKGWPKRIVNLLWSVANELSNRMGLDQQTTSIRKWQSGPRQMFLNSHSPDGVAEWENCIRRQSSRWLSKYVRATPIPASVFPHVQSYHLEGSDSGHYLRQHYPNIFSNNRDQLRSKARTLRVDAVVKHWQFLSNSGFLSSSGKGYIGVGMPARKSIKNRALKTLTAVNALGLPPMTKATDSD